MEKVRLDLFNSKLGLIRGASKIKEVLWYVVKRFIFLTSIPYPYAFKCFILRLFGAKIGRGVIIKPRVNIHFPWKLDIGNHVWIGEEVFILNFETITLENHTCISQRAFLCGGNHDYRNPSMPYKNRPIKIEEGAWVGASVFVGPHVVVGQYTVISAGSVVTSSLESNSIYKGNPAVFISTRWKD